MPEAQRKLAGKMAPVLLPRAPKLVEIDKLEGELIQ